MKEFLFIIWDANSDITKFIKVKADNMDSAKEKFAKAFMPYVDFDFTEIEYMLENEDIKLYRTEYKEIINL